MLQKSIPLHICLGYQYAVGMDSQGHCYLKRLEEAFPQLTPLLTCNDHAFLHGESGLSHQTIMFVTALTRRLLSEPNHTQCFS